MAERVAIDGSLEGKRVVAETGEVVGMVSGVRSGTVYVDLDPSVSDRLLAKLGWDAVQETDYPLSRSAVRRITDDAVHLNEL